MRAETCILYLIIIIHSNENTADRCLPRRVVACDWLPLSYCRVMIG